MEAQPRTQIEPASAPETVRVLMPSPIGDLGVELLGTAVTRLTIEPPAEERPFFLPLHLMDGSDFLDEVFGRLAEYFAGARRKLDLQFDLSLTGTSGFARRVLKEAAKIAYGRTRTYAGIAEACGRHDCEDVQAILLANPIPILIPCHRVLPDEGGIGDYVGGSQRKQWLLDLESAESEDA